MSADLNYDPDAKRPWQHHCRLRLSQAKLKHPDLPLPLEDLEAVLECVDGKLKLERLTAHSGTTPLEIKDGWAYPGCPDPDLECKVKIDNLHLNRELFAALPASVREFDSDFRPAGIVNLSVEFGCRCRSMAPALRRGAEGHLQHASSGFPMRLDHIQGTIEHRGRSGQVD